MATSFIYTTRFPNLANLSALLWAIALVAYTWAVATRARTSMPLCPCEKYAQAFLPLNQTLFEREEGNSKACYDAVKWALREEKRDWRYTGEEEVIAKEHNSTGELQGRNDTGESTRIEGGNVGLNDAEPLEADLYMKFFDGLEGRERKFVEIGASDSGANGSITRFFGQSLNWSGVIVDGGAAFGKKKRMEGVEIVNRVVCEPGLEGRKLRWIDKEGGRGGLEIYMTQNDLNLNEKEAKEAKKSAFRTVNCVSLGVLLDKMGLGVVDLLAVDVNGAERGVIEGLNEEKVHVRVVVAEVGVDDGDKERGVRRTMLEKGFCYSHRIGRKEVWVGDHALKLSHCAWVALKEDP